MLSLGPLAFAAPWMLAALVALPLLWWLLKVTPPAPKRIDFPPVRILMALKRSEETPQKTPLWLLIMRLALAALVVLALAHPLLNPGAGLSGEGPAMIVVDDGWSAARNWRARSELLSDLVDQAARENRAIVLVTTAPENDTGIARARGLMSAKDARLAVQALKPKAWPVDRRAAGEAIEKLNLAPPVETVWLSNGLDDGQASAFAAQLDRLGRLHYFAEDVAELPHALLPATLEGPVFRLHALRAGSKGEETVQVRASAERGRVLAQQSLTFAEGATEAEAALDLPIEMRNRLVRLEIENEESAGSVVLLDERWRRRPVGLVSGGPIEAAQPLLSDLYYLERALRPFSDVRTGDIGELLERELAVLVLADIGQVAGLQRDALVNWIERGGVLVRFAGPRLAENVDDLIPVRLRSGGRTLGGALSWTRPARLAPFPESSPFFGLTPPDEVEVRRQVLAEPALDLAAKTWAALADGTPLVTARRRGAGWLVLFHTTANTTWTSLPLSGIFVDMLQRIVRLSQGVGGGDGDRLLRPFALLDAFGRPSAASANVKSIPGSRFAETRVGPGQPPGFYGAEESRRALNLTSGMTRLVPIGELPPGASRNAYGESGETDLKPWLLAAAIVLGLIDLLVSLRLRGLVAMPLRGAAAVLAVVLAGLPTSTGTAQESGDSYIISAVSETRLAYVLTGDREVDEMSRAGLVGLTTMLTRRTSIEPAAPLGVDVESDDLTFFPLLYWPVVARQPTLSAQARAKLNTFMKYGGTIVFDTRDQETAGVFGGARIGPGTRRLRRILNVLNIPPLTPVPRHHVLTKSFYLIQEFPGRWAGGKVWVVRHPGGVNDGVSSIIIGGNDWAAAWAIDDEGHPLAPVVPGGPMQRERAFRFGINLVMYSLTGNYKADQVHVPAILERLGQ